MQEKIICEKCKKRIFDNENRVNYSETNPKGGKTYIDLHFHTDCWIEHYNESLDKKIKNYSNQIIRASKPMIDGIVSGVSKDEVYKI